MILNIAKDFSETPGDRYIDESKYSAEEFRETLLEPLLNYCIDNDEVLVVNFDGSYGYSSGFLEESFGGLIRKGYDASDILNNMAFISKDDETIINKVTNYMIENERSKKYEKYKR